MMGENKEVGQDHMREENTRKHIDIISILADKDH